MTAENDSMLQPWEQAFVAVSHDATVGRLFKGIVHNLNGVLQAFSMQGELLSMMFHQTGALLDALDAGIPKDQRETFERLRKLLSQRAIIVQQMEEKVGLSLNIMQNTLALRDNEAQQHQPQTSDVNAVIKSEADFLAGDMFFKHKVEKYYQFAPNLPDFPGNPQVIHFVVHSVLDNANEAMRDRPDPHLTVTTRRGDGEVDILVEDTGEGIAPEHLERMFEPFFTTRPGHIGAGLYLARKLMQSVGGRITAESSPGRTCVSIFYPC